MTNSLLTSVALANGAGGLAVLAVLALRVRARAWFGAKAAYALWLAVPAAMAAGLMPARTIVGPAGPMSEGPAFAFIGGDAAWTGPIEAAATAPAGLSLSQVLLAAWLAGVVLWLARVAIAQHRSVARFGAIVPQAGPAGIARAANPAVGPALIGVFRPRMVVPSDFEARFGKREQAMVLAHEQAHLAAGHVWINAFTALLRSICWFNPLVHIGAAYARVDQELACDAAVVGKFPGERRTYAEALLKTQLDAVSLPLGCSWPGKSPNLLMERLEMLALDTPTHLRLMAGSAAAAVLTLSAGLAAWAVQPPQVVPAPAAAIDPLADLGRDVSAVFAEPADPRILLSEEERGVASTRTIRPGEEYRDGWKLAVVAPDAVTMKKGAASRVIVLEGRKQAPAVDTAAVAALAKVATSNAGAGGVNARPRSAELDGAITALNRAMQTPPTGEKEMNALTTAVNSVIASGGSAQDIAAVQISQSGFPPGASLDPATARFVRNEAGEIRINMVETSSGLERGLMIPGIQLPGGNMNAPLVSRNGPSVPAP